MAMAVRGQFQQLDGATCFGPTHEWHLDIENSVTLAKMGSYLFFPISTKNAYLNAIRR